MSYEKQRILSLNLDFPKKKTPSSKGELEFKCPFCYDGEKKYKLAINIKNNVGHCWICEWHGNVVGLLHALNARQEDIDAYIRASSRFGQDALEPSNKQEEELELPEGFCLVPEDPSSITMKATLRHLTQVRNLSLADIKKYRIGFTGSRIVVPSYDDSGALNYYVARSFPLSNPCKYKNPTVPKNKIIFNDLFIDWKSTVVLVEGVFDALVTPNAVPLLGKEIGDNILRKLVQNRSEVVLMLDGDKEGHKATRKLLQKLQGFGLSVRVVTLDGSDPSSIGREKVKELLAKALPAHSLDFVFYT